MDVCVSGRVVGRGQSMDIKPFCPNGDLSQKEELIGLKY